MHIATACLHLKNAQHSCKLKNTRRAGRFAENTVLLKTPGVPGVLLKTPFC
jgi:hypothetical protein